MISAIEIKFAYERTPVINGVSFSASAGDWLGLLGPNGSGKTTLLKCLSGILRPQSGEIELTPSPSPSPPATNPSAGRQRGEGKSIFHFNRAEIARSIAVVPQDSSILFQFTAFEIVLMGRTPYQKIFGFESSIDIEIATQAMKETDTWQFAKRPFQELSGGERQRVIIARALAQQPKILLLDEPTTFLDIKHQQDILKLLKKLNEQGMTIISAMHDINLALLYCKSIMLLKDGTIYKIGATNETVTYSNLKAVFDTEVYVGINDLTGKPYYLPYEKRI